MLVHLMSAGCSYQDAACRWGGTTGGECGDDVGVTVGPAAWALRLPEFGVYGTSENEERAYIQAGANEIGYRLRYPQRLQVKAAWG
jgi:hypothetical protein